MAGADRTNFLSDSSALGLGVKLKAAALPNLSAAAVKVPFDASPSVFSLSLKPAWFPVPVAQGPSPEFAPTSVHPS